MPKQTGAESLRRQIIEFPPQLTAGTKLVPLLKLSKPTELVFCGMGGSALYADLLLMHLEGELTIPTRIHRDYGLPANVSKDALVIACSYSGNTEETISSLEASLKARLKTVVIAHGGKMLDIAKAEGIPHIIIPECIQPRYSPGYMFSAAHQLLSYLGLAHQCEKEMEKLTKWLGAQRGIENLGKTLAQQLKGKVPLIYSSSGYRAVARIGKIKINENAKVPAFYNELPEMNHNEMVGFTRPLAKYHSIILTDGDESPQMKLRIKATQSVLGEQDITSSEVQLEGETNLQRAFYGLLYFDWASYHLAMEYGIDPVPVEMVERFKGMLKRV